MSDDQDTMDEWAAALAEAEGDDEGGQGGEAEVAQLEELTDEKADLTVDEKKKAGYYFRYSSDYFNGSRAFSH